MEDFDFDFSAPMNFHESADFGMDQSLPGQDMVMYNCKTNLELNKRSLHLHTYSYSSGTNPTIMSYINASTVRIYKAESNL
jgi:hypothetical protein